MLILLYLHLGYLVRSVIWDKFFDCRKKSRRQLNIEGIAKMRQMRVLMPRAYLTPDTREDARQRRRDNYNRRFLGINPPPKWIRIFKKPDHYELRKQLITGRQSLKHARKRFVEVHSKYLVVEVKKLQKRVKRRKELQFQRKMRRIANYRAFRKRRKKEFSKWLQYWELKW